MVETLTNITPKPTAYNGQPFNFCDLDDRIFEILLYQIFKARIEMNDYTLNELFDNVVLMQGVGERGRDCFLAKNGKNYGVIQCKKLSKNINKPDTQKEILKFIIHYTQDKTLIHDIDNFYYYFAVSKGIAETATNFLANFNNWNDEVEIKSIFNSIINNYASLKNVKYEDVSNDIKDVISKIKVKTILPADLSQYLSEHDKLIKNFFKVFTVTDNTLLEGIIENYLTPILNQLYNKKQSKEFTFRFKEYLQRAYSFYSSSRTLVFGNQQKKLEDFYYPLNIENVFDTSKNKETTYKIAKYEEDFLPKYKKAIIVDNGGMGKSTIMKWLFLDAIKQRKGIPIFIELRKLINNKTILDEIIEELNPIDDALEKEMVTRLIAKGNFIFFFDGYDEIRDIDRNFVTSDLQSFISKSSNNNLFIITSRPETALNTFSDFKAFKIKSLLKKEAFELIKKIGNNSDKSQRLIKKINEDEIENIDEFLTSPLLVSLLYKKFEHRENLPLKLQEFYYDVFEALFQDHDLTKGDSFIRDKKCKLSFSEFFEVLREFSFFTLKKNEIEYNDAVISKYLNEISKRLPHINLDISSFIEDLVKTVPLFNKEGLEYRWAHKSFQEYFAAEFICRDSKDRQIDILKTMYKSDKFDKLNFVFSLCYDIDYNTFTKAITIPYLKEFISYCDLISTKIKNIDPETLLLIKSLTFNQSHYVIFKDNTPEAKQLIKSLFSSLNKKGEIKNKNILPHNYILKSINFGKTTITSSVSKYDLLYFFIKKKESFIKKINIKQTISIEEAFKGQKVPNTMPFNQNLDFTNIPKDRFKFLTQNIIASSPHLEYLDYDECLKYIEVYNKKEADDNSDYYINGF